MPTVERRGEIHLLDLGSDANRINPDWIAAVEAALDEVEAEPPPRALVTTASGEFFSMGLDLEWIGANRDDVARLIDGMHTLFARTLELPVPTVAAIPGHAIAGGALFTLAHDYRVMREDRGFWCLPEVDVRISITPGLLDLVRARLAPQVAHEAATSGRRYTGRAALELGIVDELAPEGDLVAAAVARAERLSEKDPETYGTIKARLYRPVTASLRDRDANQADAARFDFALALMRGAQSANS